MAAHDSALITEMKKSLVVLYKEAAKREMVYVAIEHNAKYLSILC